MTWLKRQLREAQDTIIQLRESKRMSEERNENHFKECELTMENVHMALANMQKKLKGNAFQQRQVMNLEKGKMVSQEMLQVSKL
jgi:hypothetical protein